MVRPPHSSSSSEVALILMMMIVGFCFWMAFGSEVDDQKKSPGKSLLVQQYGQVVGVAIEKVGWSGGTVN